MARLSTSLSLEPFAWCGVGLLFVTAGRMFFLERGGPPVHAALALLFLMLACLAELLLWKEGCGKRERALLLLPIGLALLLRACLLDHATLDYQDFLSQWVEHFRQNGGIAALKDPVGNYNVPYLYMLALISYLPIPDLYLIKFFSIVFDVLLAWGGLRLSKQLTRSQKAPFLVFAALLLLPTVVLNGSCWGQCDSVYAAFCVHALACALDDQPKVSLALLAFAFSFKLQAIFIIPLWCALWFSGRVRFHQFFVFPGVFALTMAPAVLLGKPIGDLLRIYLDQAGDPSQHFTINFNSPSVFAFVPYGTEVDIEKTARIAIFLAFAYLFLLLGFLFWKRERLDALSFVLAGAAMCIGIPFFLPYMHERYFFLGGVLLVVASAGLPSLSVAATGAELASLGGYHAYLCNRYFWVLTLLDHTWAQLGEGICMTASLVCTVTALVGLPPPEVRRNSLKSKKPGSSKGKRVLKQK